MNGRLRWGLIAPASQPPLLCYGVRPVPMRGPPPWWAGNPLPRHWQGTTTRAFSTHPPRAPPLGAYFLLHLLIEFPASRATNSPLTSTFAVGAAGVEPAASALYGRVHAGDQDHDRHLPDHHHSVGGGYRDTSDPSGAYHLGPRTSGARRRIGFRADRRLAQCMRRGPFESCGIRPLSRPADHRRMT